VPQGGGLARLGGQAVEHLEAPGGGADVGRLQGGDSPPRPRLTAQGRIGDLGGDVEELDGVGQPLVERAGSPRMVL
jgi:hypothetical protein